MLCQILLSIPNPEEETLAKRKISFHDIIQVPKHLRPTGPGGKKRCAAKKIPNPEVTSDESEAFIAEADGRKQQKDKQKDDKDDYMKKSWKNHNAQLRKEKKAATATTTATRGGARGRGRGTGRGRGRGRGRGGPYLTSS